jgi:hypothetical protein
MDVCVCVYWICFIDTLVNGANTVRCCQPLASIECCHHHYQQPASSSSSLALFSLLFILIYIMLLCCHTLRTYVCAQMIIYQRAISARLLLTRSRSLPCFFYNAINKHTHTHHHRCLCINVYSLLSHSA